MSDPSLVFSPEEKIWLGSSLAANEQFILDFRLSKPNPDVKLVVELAWDFKDSQLQELSQAFENLLKNRELHLLW